MRPLYYTLPDGTKRLNPLDVVDRHAGIILGPEFDLYCDACYANLPTVKDLITEHKSAVAESKKDDLS